MLRVSEPGGIIHEGTWVYDERVGRTACGLKFVATEGFLRLKFVAARGFLRLQDDPPGGHPRGLILLEAPILVDCMTCIVHAALSP